MRIALVLVVFAACSSKEPPSTDTPFCDPELSQMSSSLEAALAAPPDLAGEAFAMATEQFTRATMCGPDMAQIIRDWQTHFKGGGGDRRALLVRFGDEAKRVSSVGWRMPAKLASAIEQAR